MLVSTDEELNAVEAELKQAKELLLEAATRLALVCRANVATVDVLAALGMVDKIFVYLNED